MLKLDKFVIDLKIGGFEINNFDLFQSLVIEQHSGGILPSFELVLSLPDTKIMKEFKINKLITIGFGKTDAELRYYKFRLVNFSSTLVDDNGFTIFLSGVSDVLDYIFNTKIEVFDNKASYQALQGGVTLDKKIEYTDSCIQHWIKYNISEKQFVEDVLERTYIPNSYPIFGLNIEKKLLVYDAKKQFAKGPKVTFKHQDVQSDTIVGFESMSIESNNVLQNFMSSGKELISLEPKNWKRITHKTDLKSLNGKNYYDKKLNTKYATEIDSYNTHPMYFDAKVTNYAKWNQLQMYKVNLVVVNQFVTNDILTILDPVKLVNHSGQHQYDELGGKYLVESIIYKISRERTSQRFILVRDFIND